MVVIKFALLLVGIVGAAFATDQPPACAVSNWKAAVNTTKVHLLCNQVGAVLDEAGVKQYSCVPEGAKKDYELDAFVKKDPDSTLTSQISSLVLTNKIDAKKVYTITSGTVESKKTSYWWLQGKSSCSVSSSAAQLGGFDPTSVYVYDLNVDDRGNQ